MCVTGRELRAIFPGEGLILFALETEDAHFRDLAARHRELESQIRNIELAAPSPSDEAIEELKTERERLLTEVGELIAARKAE